MLGSIVGIHRDADTKGARWAVLDSPDAEHRFLVVPIVQAINRGDGLHVPYDAAQVLSAPVLGEPTRMYRSEEAALIAHYGLGDDVTRQSSPAPPRPGTDPVLTMIRSEERLSVSALEWRPYQRLRISKAIRTEEITEVVTVRHEELVIDDVPISAIERLEVSFGTARLAANEDIDMILHREELVIHKRLVPYEHVRVHTARVTADWPIEASLRKERVDVEREAL